MAGVRATTIRKWDERGLIKPVGHDDHGRALYLCRDIANVERRKRQRGRPRKWQIPAHRELPPGGAEFLTRGAEAMADFDDSDAAISAACARLIVRGEPEGQPVTDLPRWLAAKTIEQLRDVIISIAILEIAESEAGEIRWHRPRFPVEPDPERGAFDTTAG